MTVSALFILKKKYNSQSKEWMRKGNEFQIESLFFLLNEIISKNKSHVKFQAEITDYLP